MHHQSAGILLYRKINAYPEVMLLHPGGPFWKNKDMGSWSIPKGEFTDEEDPLQAAKREFEEETGSIPEGNFLALKPVKLKSGKMIYAWAVEGNLDVSTIVCNHISIEWPPKSGKYIMVPECDRGEWFTLEEAKQKINPGQVGLLDQLAEILRQKF
jgi:predicted NUDIX family NTP pyrophosphohydrolase